jgi:phosphoglycolate phosphatase
VRERHYAEDLSPLAPDEATRRFGQNDHVRIFGARDLQATLGMIFALPEHYALLDTYDAALLARHGIPEVAWSGWSTNSVLVLGKEDLLLRG